jgi:DNA-binding SARP family transcriptional activator/tetratricopeptide (TPR) repeat protein
LGPPAWHGGGRVQPLTCERPHQLLVHLACAGDWVSRDQLAALWWPDRPTEAARSNLRKVVLLARRALNDLTGAAALQERPGALRWAAATDVAAFNADAATGHTDAAMARWGGEFCAAWDAGLAAGWADWQTQQRQRVGAIWRRLALQAARQAPALADARRHCEQLLARDPLDEEALTLLLQRLLAGGRVVDAQHAYERYAGELALQLGLEPGNALRMLMCAAQANTQRVAEPASDDEPIGRAGELKWLVELQSAESRPWVQVLGTGGVGKTTLLRRWVRGQAPGAPVWMVDLDGCATLDAALRRVARAVGVPLRGEASPGDQLAQWLGPRQALLVLDSAEVLGVELQPWLAELARLCPALQLGLGSREPLQLPASRVAPTLRLDGLAWPDADEPAPQAFDAVRLFARHARRARPGFDLDAEAAHVAVLAAHVQGLPLALELAAGWLRHFSVAEVLAELRCGLDALQGPVPQGRQGSIAGILERSWALLVPREREALAGLVVCVQGFDAAAARAVGSASLPVLSGLLDKGLLRADEAGRLSMHALVRQFLKPHADPAAVQRHAEHFAQRLAQLHDGGVRDEGIVREIGPDLDNVLAMWQWALAQGRVDLLEQGVCGFATLANHAGLCEVGLHGLGEAARQLEPGHAAPPPGRTLAWIEALKQLAYMNYHLGRMDAAAAAAADAVAAARPVGGDALHSSLNVEGIIAWARGDRAAAEAQWAQALQLVGPDGNPRLRAIYVGNLGLIAQGDGRYESARACFAEALAMHRHVGNQSGETEQLINLGTALYAVRRYEEALSLLAEGMALARRIGYHVVLAYALRLMAQAQLGLKRYVSARESCAAALAAIERGSEPQQRCIVLCVLAQALHAERKLDAAVATLAEAATLALAGAQEIDRCSIAAMHAQLLADRGRLHDAARVWLFLLQHPGADAEGRQAAEHGLQTLESRLDAAVLAELPQQVAALDMRRILIGAAADVRCAGAAAELST